MRCIIHCKNGCLKNTSLFSIVKTVVLETCRFQVWLARSSSPEQAPPKIHFHFCYAFRRRGAHLFFRILFGEIHRASSAEPSHQSQPHQRLARASSPERAHQSYNFHCKSLVFFETVVSFIVNMGVSEAHGFQDQLASASSPETALTRGV